MSDDTLSSLITQAAHLSSDLDKTLLVLGQSLQHRTRQEHSVEFETLQDTIATLKETIDHIKLAYSNADVTEYQILNARNGIANACVKAVSVTKLLRWYQDSYTIDFFKAIPAAIIRYTIALELAHQWQRHIPQEMTPQLWKELITNQGLIRDHANI